MIAQGLPFSDPSFLAYLAAFTAATLAPLAGVYRALRIADSDIRRGLTALLLASSGWAGAHVGVLLVTTPLVKDLLYTAGLLVGFATVGAWLYFCSAYTGRTLHRNRTVRRLALLTFAVVALLKITNPYHQLYHTLEYIQHPFPHLAIRHHVVYWVIMGLSYALSLVGGFMLLELFTKIGRDIRPSLLLVGLIGLPPLFNIIGYAEPFLLDVTHEPIGVAVFASGVLFTYLAEFQSVRLAGSQKAPTIVLNADGRIRDCNEAAIALFPELGRTEVAGQPLAAVLPDVDAARSRERPVFTLHRNGDDRFYRVRENRFEAGGTQLGQLVLLADITERKRREEQLRAAKAQAEAASRMKSALLTNMGHELRTPLTAMIGYAETIADEASGRTGRLVPDFAQSIAQGGRRLLSTLDGVLTLAKLEAGEMELASDPVDPAAVLQQVADEMRPQAQEQAVTLEVEPDDAGIRVSASVEGMQIVLRQLVSNAIKFTEAGGTVRLRVRSAHEEGVLEVEDTGIGMKPDAVPTLFQPFRQASEGLQREYEGAGVGLAVVQRAVDQMGGSIQVKTALGAGACFAVHLPRAAPLPASSTETAPALTDPAEE
jgi:signal transduction histidine kinase